jgi:hypothetical protein
LQASLTGGNRNDVTQLMPLIQDIPPVRGRRGRPRRRPDTVYADRAYDHDKYRKQVRAVGVTPVIARRGTGTRLRAGPVPLGRRADVCPVALVPATAHPLGDPRRHPRGIPSPGVRHHLPPPVDQPVILLGVHLPGFRGRIDRMLGRSPGECRKGQHAPTWRKAADDQLAAYTDVPAGQKHQAVEPVAVCTSGSLTSGSKDDAEAPKATGRVGAVSRAGQG